MKLVAGGKNRHIPPGQYKARVIRIESGSFFGRRKAIHMTFEILEGPSKGTEINAFFNAHYEHFSPYTKFYRWYSIVTRESPEAGEEMDTDLFMGKVILVNVEDKVSTKTKNLFSNVTDIIEVIHDDICFDAIPLHRAPNTVAPA